MKDESRRVDEIRQNLARNRYRKWATAGHSLPRASSSLVVDVICKVDPVDSR